MLAPSLSGKACFGIVAAGPGVGVSGLCTNTTNPRHARGDFTQSPSAQDLQDWRGGMAHTPPPQTGCFTSSYPNTEWQQVPCANVQPRPNPLALGTRPLPSTVGNGNDVVTAVTSGHISLAVGSFESVTGVTSLGLLSVWRQATMRCSSTPTSSPPRSAPTTVARQAAEVGSSSYSPMVSAAALAYLSSIG